MGVLSLTVVTTNNVTPLQVVMMPNGKWYGQACAIQWGHIDNLGGCFSVVAASPGGPYILQEKNFALLGYASTDGIPAYFSRFYIGMNGTMLVNYQQKCPGTFVYSARVSALFGAL
jgi:hypothetical protein